MRESLAKTARGMKAPYAVVDAIEAGPQGGLRRRFSARARTVLDLRGIHRIEGAASPVFLPSAKSPKSPTFRRTRRSKKSSAPPVVGAGTMGGGIAMNYANAGIPVLLKEVDRAALDRGLATIRKNYEVTDVEGQDHTRTARKNSGVDHAHHLV
jgi:3-hydroxyacyl-CoA dehydrogenase